MLDTFVGGRWLIGRLTPALGDGRRVALDGLPSYVSIEIFGVRQGASEIEISMSHRQLSHPSHTAAQLCVSTNPAS